LYEPYNPGVPFSVRDLLDRSGIDLRLVAGRRGTSNAIRWVHVSELDDPTPWLKGGELLLITGMGVGRTPARQRAYIDRLVAADLAGLGFGVGFSFQKAPVALREAAERRSFPVFEVPYALPFIAITEAVFTRLVADQYDLLSRSLEAEHTLTRAVLEGEGVAGVVAALSRATRGWGMLLDLHGAVIAVNPASAASHASLLRAELQTSKAERLRFTLSLIDGGDHISVQPVSAQGRVEAFLAVGKREALSQFDRIVSSHAVALLALELSKSRAVSEAERRLKGDLLDQILKGAIPTSDARMALERMGFDLARPVAAVVLAGAEPLDLARAFEETASRKGTAFLVSPSDDVVLAVVQPEGPGFLASFSAAMAPDRNGSVIAGAGSLVPMDQMVQSVREARYALQLCKTEGRTHAEFNDLGTYQLLLTLQDPAALRTFAESVLQALDRYDEQHGGELLSSLRAFLERNARWETAAKELFVHRHTLRYRMRKVEELTGRDLSSARDRMEFFLAIRARDLLASADSPEASGRTRSARKRR
jgi:PucR family transcriptional regulator, purine catabolism regulatory protein